MYRSLARLFAAAIFGLVCAWSTHAQVAKPDSTQVTASPPLTPSNCPNITWQWYAAGSVPAGYYKANSDGNCYPIPSCTSNQVWNSTSQVCGCPAGTSWDLSYGTCHAPCGGGTAWNGASCASICSAGTAWNGSTCASICTGGQSWNGSACACPSGTVWNGSSCGAPPTFTGFSAAPTSQTIGSGNFVISWSTSGSPTSGSVSCTGANAGSFALSPVSSGAGSVVASNSGATICTGTISNSYGTATSSALTLTASCPSGTSWNGSGCGSVCSGGQSWNGSACVCPGGQVWNGSSCGVAPSLTSFGVSPASTTVGSNYSVSWGTSGSGPITVTMNCSGANAASYTLSPSSGGTGSLAASAPGSTTCTATAASSWGSATSGSATVTAVCPGGQQWDSGARACVTAAAGCLAVAGYKGPTLSSSDVVGLSGQTPGAFQGYPSMYGSVAAGAVGASGPQDVITGWCSGNGQTMCGMIHFTVGHVCQANGTWTNSCPNQGVWDSTNKVCVVPPPAWQETAGSYWSSGGFVTWKNISSQTATGVQIMCTIYSGGASWNYYYGTTQPGAGTPLSTALPGNWVNVPDVPPGQSFSYSYVRGTGSATTACGPVIRSTSPASQVSGPN